jgi:hypothetical protein
VQGMRVQRATVKLLGFVGELRAYLVIARALLSATSTRIVESCEMMASQSADGVYVLESVV